MGRVYIATKKSKQIIKDAHKIEKNGGTVDWNEVFEANSQASAKTLTEQIKAIGEKKR
jgi:hypothetical protein